MNMPNRSHVLQGAIQKAARGAYEAERDLTWASGQHVAQAARLKQKSIARCERVLMQALRENLIRARGVRDLVGVVLDAQLVARWSIEGQVPTPHYWTQVARLKRAVDKAWRTARRRQSLALIIGGRHE